MKENKSTFCFQKNLPPLPIPSLEDSLARFIEWIKPLLSEEDFEDLSKEISLFLDSGEGYELQKSLVEWSEREDISNWLEPFWTDGYLSPRSSCAINSNVFYLLEPNLSISGPEKQLKRAALLLHGFLRFHKKIKNKTLSPEFLRDCPICMNAYSLLFSTTRIPEKNIDSLRLPDRGSFPTSTDERHILLLSSGRLFCVDLLDAFGEIAQPSDILFTLMKIKKYLKEKGQGDSLGTLTASNRENWASLREELLRFSDENGPLFDKLERALFALSLDPVSTGDVSELGWNMLAGDPSNRWFDKSVQLIVNLDGEAAVNMEHSAIDGSPMVRAAAFVSALEKGLNMAEEGSELPWTELEFKLTEHVKESINDARADFIDFGARTVLKTLDFKELDKNTIKKAGVSPDGLVQMAIQLAQYKVFGECHNTYEPAMTRLFYHGRTEPIRVVSPQSMDFVISMESSSMSGSEKFSKLKIATEEHSKRSRLSREGNGIDRHLLGLKKIALMKGKLMPSLFKTKGYEILCENYISTSTTNAEGLYMAGFGPVVEDGFGVRYVHKPGLIRFVVTSRVHNERKLSKLISEIGLSLKNISRILPGKQQ